MPYYRALGIVVGVLVLVVAALGWSALASANTRRGLVTLAIMAVGLKLAHWGYYAPEWNYRHSQGPWGRAIGQWVPRKWPVYTFHDWPPDLAFFIGRPVRQLPSARFLNYVPGPECHFVLLQASEFANWPEQAPPLTLVARVPGPVRRGTHPGPHPGLTAHPRPERPPAIPEPGRQGPADRPRGGMIARPPSMRAPDRTIVRSGTIMQSGFFFRKWRHELSQESYSRVKMVCHPWRTAAVGPPGISGRDDGPFGRDALILIMR